MKKTKKTFLEISNFLNKKWIFWSILLVSLLILVINTLLPSPIFVVFAVLLAIFSLLFLDFNNKFCYMFGMINLAGLYRWVKGTSLFTILLLVFYCYLLILLIRNKRIKKGNIVYVVLLSLSIATSAISEIFYKGFSLSVLTSILSFLAYFLIFPLSFEFDIDRRKCLQSLITVFLVSTAFSIMLLFSNKIYTRFCDIFTDRGIIYDYSQGAINKTIRFCGYFDDPNFLCVPLFISISSCTVFLFSPKIKKNKKEKIILISAIFLSIVFGVLTKSKFFVIFFMVYVLTLLFIFLLKIFKTSIYNGLLIILICAFLIISVSPYLIDSLFKRLFAELDTRNLYLFLQSITTYRHFLATVGSNELFTNPSILLFGNGIGNGLSASTNLSPHSSLISLTMRVGLFGVIFLLYPFAFFLKKYIKKNCLMLAFFIFVPVIFSIIAIPGDTSFVFPAALFSFPVILETVNDFKLKYNTFKHLEVEI